MNELEICSSNITLALDNTPTYEDWLIVQSYLDIYQDTIKDLRDMLLTYGECFEGHVLQEFQKRCLEKINNMMEEKNDR